jgi:hypothetical protein
MLFEMMSSFEMCIVYCITLVKVVICRQRVYADRMSIFDTLNKSTSIYNIDNSNVLASLLSSCRLVVGGLLRYSSSVKAQVWRRCTFDRFIGPCLFDHLERMTPSFRVAKIQPSKLEDTQDDVYYACCCPFAILCSQRNNGGPYHNLVPGQKLENLIFMNRFASIAKTHWRGYTFDQFYQHDCFKRTFPAVRVAIASFSGLINARNTFVTRFREWATYKCVFNRLSWRKLQDHHPSDGPKI